METSIIVFHVLAAICMIALVLIQQGKGADMGASFGAGASQTLFGSRGSSNALTRSTAILATIFFATSLALSVVAKNRHEGAGMFDIPIAPNSEVPAVSAPAKSVDDVPTVKDNAGPAAGDVPAVPQ